MEPYAVNEAELYTFFIGELIILISLFLFVYKRHQKIRNMANTPTSTIQSAAQGYCEFKGRATQLTPLISPLTKQPCAWWSFTIDELDNDMKRKWNSIKNESSISAFKIDDNTGECIIHPEGAEVIPHVTKIWYGPHPFPLKTHYQMNVMSGEANYRYSESLLLLDFPLYAIGMYHTIHHDHQNDDVGDLIREWKTNYQALIDEFDANQDGKLDEKEWQAVVAKAEAVIKQQNIESQRSFSLDIISEEGLTSGQHFILSGDDEKTVKKNKGKFIYAYHLIILLLFAHSLYVLLTILAY